MNIKELTDLTKSVYLKTFNSSPDLQNVDDDCIFINDAFEIRREPVEVTRKTLKGTTTKNVDGWALYVWVRTSGNHMEPPDVDENFIISKENFNDILVEMVKVIATEMARNSIEVHYTMKLQGEPS